MRKRIKTTKKQIIEWGRKNINECGYGVDASEMHSHCWRCGHNDQNTERCHVIPAALGGEDIPSNYRLLCNRCHHEAPNVNDPDEMDKWIRRTNIGVYNIFWHVRESLGNAIEETTRHWGHNKLNASTEEWVENKFLDNLVKNKNLKYINSKSDAAFAVNREWGKCLKR